MHHRGDVMGSFLHPVTRLVSRTTPFLNFFSISQVRTRASGIPADLSLLLRMRTNRTHALGSRDCIRSEPACFPPMALTHTRVMNSTQVEVTSLPAFPSRSNAQSAEMTPFLDGFFAG